QQLIPQAHDDEAAATVPPHLMEDERKKQAARERQAQILKQFAEAQALFLENHQDLMDEDTPDDEDNLASVEADVEAENPSTVMTADVANLQRWTTPGGTCIVCQEDVSESNGPYGMIGYLQHTKFLQRVSLDNRDFVDELVQTTTDSADFVSSPRNKL